MRLTVSMLFIGFWLKAGLAQNFSNETYAKPIISITPTGVLSLGENVTITCKTDNNVSKNFYFWRKGACKQEYELTEMKENEYSIYSISRSDGQIYFCAYCFPEDKNPYCSDYSDEVNITLRDPSLSKPIIHTEYFKGINTAIITCKGPENGLTFSLWNSEVMKGSLKANTDSNTVKYPFYSMKPEDSGNYSCHYQLKGNPFVWSLRSEPAEIIVKPKLPKPESVPTKPESMPTKPESMIYSVVASVCFLILVLLFPYIFFKIRRRGITSRKGNKPENVEMDNGPENTEEVKEPETNEKDKEPGNTETDSVSESFCPC